MIVKLASLEENSKQLSNVISVSSEHRPLPFTPFPRVRAPDDLPRLLTTANPQMHVHDWISSSRSHLFVVTKDHKVAFFPTANGDGDQRRDCCPDTVIDSNVVSLVETDYHLYGHAGSLGPQC